MTYVRICVCFGSHSFISCIIQLITETDDSQIRNMTLDDYSKSELQESNWLVRFLTNHRESKISRDHLELAKEILRTKSIVGIYDELRESLSLFEDYFSWDKIINKGPFAKQAYETCVHDIVDIENSRGREAYEMTKDVMMAESDTIYYRLVESNEFDIELYWYAKELFREQQEWIEFTM